MYPRFFNDEAENQLFVDEWASKPKSKKAVKKTGRGGFLSSLISEGGAAGGAALGGTMGSAVPGIGTIIGAGLGGLIGGFGGRLAENKVRDDRFDAKSFREAIGEGAMSGAFSAAGAGFQALKAAKGAKGLSSALGASDDVTKTATTALKQAPRTGMASRKGLDITSKAGGYYARENVPGIGKITVEKSKYYDDVLKKLKIPANDAGDIAARIGKVRTALGETISSTLKNSNTSLSKAQVEGFADDIMKTVNNTAGLSKEAKKFAADQIRLMKSKVKDVKGVHDFRAELDEVINWNVNPDSALAAQQGSAKIMREGIRDRLNSLVPGLKETNKLYHDVTDIEKLALRSSGRVSGEATSASGGLVSRVLSSPTANTLRAKGGRALSNVGPYTAGTGGAATQVTNQAFRQSPGNLLEAAMSTSQPEEITETTTEMPDTSNVETVQEPQQSQYPVEAVMADIQRDPKNAEKYMKLYDFIAESEGGSSGLNVTKPTSEKYSNAYTGMQSLQTLRDILTSDPSVLSKTRTPGRGVNVLGIGSTIRNATGTGEFDAAAFNAVDNLLRIRTGAQAPESEIRRYMNQIIPQANDSPALVQQKLLAMEQTFMSILDLANSPGAGQSPLYDSILNSGGQY